MSWGHHHSGCGLNGRDRMRPRQDKGKRRLDKGKTRIRETGGYQCFRLEGTQVGKAEAVRKSLSPQTRGRHLHEKDVWREKTMAEGTHGDIQKYVSKRK